jgi:hypothetical protein
MFDATDSGDAARSTSAFVASAEHWGSAREIRADAARVIDLASREPAPRNQTSRMALALALVAAAEPCSARVSG